MILAPKAKEHNFTPWSTYLPRIMHSRAFLLCICLYTSLASGKYMHTYQHTDGHTCHTLTHKHTHTHTKLTAMIQWRIVTRKCTFLAPPTFSLSLSKYTYKVLNLGTSHKILYFEKTYMGFTQNSPDELFLHWRKWWKINSANALRFWWLLQTHKIVYSQK